MSKSVRDYEVEGRGCHAESQRSGFFCMCSCSVMIFFVCLFLGEKPAIAPPVFVFQKDKAQKVGLPQSTEWFGLVFNV